MKLNMTQRVGKQLGTSQIFFSNGRNTTIAMKMGVSDFFCKVLCGLLDEEMIENFNLCQKSENAKFIELVWNACYLDDYPRGLPKEVRVVV